MNVHDWVLTCLRCVTFELDHQDFHQGQKLVQIEMWKTRTILKTGPIGPRIFGKKWLKMIFSGPTWSNASWSKWCWSIRTSWSWWFPWCCRFRLFVRFYFTFTSRWTISKIQSNFWPNGSRISLWASRKITFLCCWMGKGNSILSRTSNYWPGTAIFTPKNYRSFFWYWNTRLVFKYP